jgi:hypothetical protein
VQLGTSSVFDAHGRKRRKLRDFPNSLVEVEPADA